MGVLTTLNKQLPSLGLGWVPRLLSALGLKLYTLEGGGNVESMWLHLKYIQETEVAHACPNSPLSMGKEHHNGPH